MKHNILFLAALLLAPLAALHAAESTPTKPDMALPPTIQAEKSGGLGFDDALAKMEAVLEPQPGQAAVQHWPLTHTGSVRLVGWIQKLSLGTNAVLELLVDGSAIQTIKLDAPDVLRHGVDVVAYDLSAKSMIDVRVVSGERPVRVSVALQIVPEPFVSRWTPELPTGYPAWNEGEKEVLRKKGQDILQMIRGASKAKRGKIVIPPGDYLFHARWSQVSTLSDLHDLEIVADGVTFWFEPPMIHALLFEKCSNVNVCGLTIDFTLPCWFQARVTEVDYSAGTIRATVMKEYAPRNANGEPETAGNRALMFYDAQGRFINHRHSPGTWELAEEGGSVLCSKIERSGIPAVLRAGDHVVGTIRTGAALRSTACERMRFEDVQVWSSPGVAVYEGGGAGGNIYRRVRATRRPHTNRLQAFGADVFHLAGTDRGPTLDRCESAYSADDNLNIHGSFGRVIEKTADRRYYLEGAYDIGDGIEFWDQKSVELLEVAKVLSVQATPEGPSLAINEKYRAKGEFLVELDRPLELPPLALVVLDGKRSAAGFVVRNCWLHDNFQRTLINGSPNGILENNTLQNVGHGLVIQFETWGPWMEGPFARNLVIRNNRFLDSPPDGAPISVSMHSAGGGSDRRRFKASPVTNMTINGNYFARTSATPLNIHNVTGLTIQDNSIDYPTDAPMPKGLDHSSTVNWLYLQDCNAVSLRGNLTPTGKYARDVASMVGVSVGEARKAFPQRRWTADEAWTWYKKQPWLAGFNYVPSTAANTTEFWSKEAFDEKTIERELGMAQGLGFNTCRVFIQYLVWKHDPDGLKQRFKRFLELADKHGISVMPVLFDDCVFGEPKQTEPYLGKQREPIPGMILPSWTPSPGLKAVEDRSVWPDLERYVRDMVGAFGQDRRVLIWDLYNEPGNSGMGNRSLPLVEAAFGWARAAQPAQPAQPLTAGIWFENNDLNATQLTLSDVISFHFYGDYEGMRNQIANLKKHLRPVINTEWMARPLGSRWETDMPLFKGEAVGCYNWGLVNGRTQCQYSWSNKKGDPEPPRWFHDLFHADGRPYDPAEHEAIRKTTADKRIDWEAKDYTKPQTVPMAHTEDGIAFSEGWTRWTGTGPGKDRLHYAKEQGRKAGITFKGTGLALIHKAGPDCGIARILVDGQTAAAVELDTYSAAVEWNRRTVVVQGLSAGEHVVSVLVTDKKSVASSDTYVQLVAFEVLP